MRQKGGGDWGWYNSSSQASTLVIPRREKKEADFWNSSGGEGGFQKTALDNRKERNTQKIRKTCFNSELGERKKNGVSLSVSGGGERERWRNQGLAHFNTKKEKREPSGNRTEWQKKEGGKKMAMTPEKREKEERKKGGGTGGLEGGGVHFPCGGEETRISGGGEEGVLHAFFVLKGGEGETIQESDNHPRRIDTMLGKEVQHKKKKEKD